MSVAERRANQIYHNYHLNTEDSEVKRNLMILLLTGVGMEKNEEDEYDLRNCFHGSWGEDVPVEEYCKQLREGITEPKEIEAW